MSNIFLKKRNNDIINLLKLNNITEINNSKKPAYFKQFPPVNSEWSNSIYAYNKNSIKSVPVDTFLISNLVKSYFNLFDLKYEKDLVTKSRRMRIRLKRLSMNRTFVSKATLKHNNSKVVVNSNIYDGAYKIFLKKKFKQSLLNNKKQLTRKKQLSVKKKLLRKVRKYFYLKKKLNNIKKMSLTIFRQAIIKNKFVIKQAIADKKFSKNFLINSCFMLPQYKSLDIYKSYIWKRYIYFIRKFFRKDLLNLHYKNVLYLHESKFNKTAILNQLFKKILHNKKVEFNFTNLKYHYLNGDILTESLALKIKPRKYRPLKLFKKLFNSVKFPFNDKSRENTTNYNTYKISWLKKLNSYQVNSLFLKLNNKVYKNEFNKVIKNNFKKDVLNKTLHDIYKDNTDSFINYGIKNKRVNGLRVKVSGRISKRLTAQRSLTKIRSKGSLKTIDSSYRGLPSVLLKGYARSNVQYTKISSKTRNGSFGLKVHISSI